jgi:hypothetical protein
MASARTHSAALSVAAALTLFGGETRQALAQSASLVQPNESQVLAPEPEPVVHALPPIQIRVSIARASVNEGEVDPRAQDIFTHLPAKYHSIQMLEDRTVAVLLGEQAHVPLPTGSEVRLMPVAVHGGQLHLSLEMPDVVNTSMRLANDRAFYVGGVRLGEDTLVFKLVPEFAPYMSSPETRTAGVPSVPDVTRASDRRR